MNICSTILLISFGINSKYLVDVFCPAVSSIIPYLVGFGKSIWSLPVAVPNFSLDYFDF